MKFNSILGWSGHYLPKLQSKLVTMPCQDCHLWTGGPILGRYGSMKVYLPQQPGFINGPWVQQTIYVHRLCVMLTVPTFIINPPGYEVSHVCHQSKCCNYNHLSIEPHAINVQINSCKATQTCHGHGEFKNCIHIE